MIFKIFAVFIVLLSTPSLATELGSESYDIVIYGGTPAGIMASIQAAKMGKSTVLIVAGKHLGGMTASGLGWVDVGNPKAIGGLAKDFFRRVWSYYQQEESWQWEKKHFIQGQLQQPPPDGTMWVLEPHVGEQIFEEMLSEADVTVVRSERLQRENGVIRNGESIEQIQMESGRNFQGKVFIDASYEGDLMAAAGVSYIIGRESNEKYKESYNGIRRNLSRSNMPKTIDPYKVPGVPESGLLPRIHAFIEGNDGEGDNAVQSYNYRMCLTNIPQNRVKVEKPQGYNEEDYELVLRSIEAGCRRDMFFKLDLLPNGKTDSNNHGPFSTDFLGMSWNYAEASYEERESIAKAHENWQKGLIWTLQNHPRIPAKYRNHYAPWGLAKDEFTDNGNWPYQLYIREARRLVSSYVITEHVVLKRENVEDPIALGCYHIDSHAVRYCIGPDGYVMTEGSIYIPIGKPFLISYRALIPKEEECQNLLVPVCLSASHSAYGSVRMEPIFMVLGQAAATAASLAIDLVVPVQHVPYKELREQLLLNQLVVK